MVKGLWGKEFRNPSFVQLWDDNIENPFLWFPRKIKFLILGVYSFIVSLFKN
jgi:hypothetical protein